MKRRRRETESTSRDGRASLQGVVAGCSSSAAAAAREQNRQFDARSSFSGPLNQPIWTYRHTMRSDVAGPASSDSAAWTRTRRRPSSSNLAPLLTTSLRLLLLATTFALLSLLPILVNARSLPSTSKFQERWPCRNMREDFNNPNVLSTADSWTGGPAFVSEFWPHAVEVRDGQLFLRITDTRLNGYGRVEGMQAAVSWTRWFDKGKACASLKTAKGGGIVSAVVAIAYNASEPNVDDEIDLEWVGKDNGRFLQSNFFSESMSDYTNGVTDHPIPSENSGDVFHTYCVERTDSFIAWSVDGNTVRTEYFANYAGQGADGGPALPWRESRLVFNLWDGGSGDPGTSFWAGGPTDWTNPGAKDGYRLAVDWIEITCYGDLKPDPVVAVATTDAAAVTGTGGTTTTRVNGGAMGGIAVAATNPVAKPVVAKPTKSTLTGTLSASLSSSTLTAAATTTSFAVAASSTLSLMTDDDTSSFTTRTSRSRGVSFTSDFTSTRTGSRIVPSRTGIFASPPAAGTDGQQSATPTATADGLEAPVSATASSASPSGISTKNILLITFGAIAGTLLLVAGGFLIYRAATPTPDVLPVSAAAMDPDTKPSRDGRPSSGSSEATAHDDSGSVSGRSTATASSSTGPSSPARSGVYPTASTAAVAATGLAMSESISPPDRRQSLFSRPFTPDRPPGVPESVRGGGSTFSSSPPGSPTSDNGPFGPAYSPPRILSPYTAAPLSSPLPGNVTMTSSARSSSQLDMALRAAGVRSKQPQSPVNVTLPTTLPNIAAWTPPTPTTTARRQVERIRITYGEGVQVVTSPAIGQVGSRVVSVPAAVTAVARAASPVPQGPTETIYYTVPPGTSNNPR